MAFLTPFAVGTTTTFKTNCQRQYSNINSQPNSRSLSKSVPTRRNCPKMIAYPPADASPAQKFSPQGMSVEDFFNKSIGQWRSQRSSHNLAWAQFEAITSEIDIDLLEPNHPDVLKLCEQNDITPEETTLSFAMSWEGESDWDDDEDDTQPLQGRSVMSVIKDSDNHGRLLRSSGYAETIPAVGQWRMTDEGVFILETSYDAAAAEERIWFATPDLRMRVSQIRTSSGTGVVTASFSTEIRRLNLK